MPIDASERNFRKLRAQIIAARDTGERGAASHLADLAKSHHNAEIRRSAMVTLRAFRSELLWPIIHDVLAHSQNENIVETAIKSVGELGSEATESLLAEIYVAAQRARFGEQAARKAHAKLNKSPGIEARRRSKRADRSNQPRPPRKTVFLCHSSEDKATVVEPLVEAFRRAAVSCWYDRAEILPGDSITKKVNEGLAISRYVLAVLSPQFLGKHWPERELNAIINIEASTGIIKLIVLLVGDTGHRTRVFERFPLLNDKLYIEWNGKPGAVVDAIRRRVKADAEAA